MKDSVQNNYRIQLLSGGEMFLEDVIMDGTDDKVITFSRGYSDVVAIVNKEAIEFVLKITEEDNDADPALKRLKDLIEKSKSKKDAQTDEKNGHL